VAESQAERLGRIEEKIDSIVGKVSDLATTQAVIHTKVEALEIRREEMHERSNKISQRMDDMQEGIQTLHVQVGFSNKIMWGIGAAVVVAFVNEIFLKLI